MALRGRSGIDTLGGDGVEVRDDVLADVVVEVQRSREHLLAVALDLYQEGEAAAQHVLDDPGGADALRWVLWVERQLDVADADVENANRSSHRRLACSGCGGRFAVIQSCTARAAMT